MYVLCVQNPSIPYLFMSVYLASYMNSYYVAMHVWKSIAGRLVNKILVNKLACPISYRIASTPIGIQTLCASTMHLTLLASYILKALQLATS